MQAEIIFEDEEILVVKKPAGFPTQTAMLGEKDLVSELKNHLAVAEKREKEPYVGVIHRLDRPVEGLLIFAKTKQAAGILSEYVRKGTLKKTYYAVSEGRLREERGILENYLVKEGRPARSKVVSGDVKGAKKAILEYRFLQEKKGLFLYDITLKTGRFHQIRCQMAEAGAPLLGDALYGAGKEWGKLGLCACSLEIIHPGTGKKLVFTIEPSGEAFQNFVRGEQ